MAAPAVFVAMPTRGYAYVPSLLRAADLARRCGHELAVEIGRPIELVRSRLAARFLESTAEYLLTIDDDIVAPDDALDRLLAANAPVATAPCPIALANGIVANVKAVGSAEWVAVPPRAVFPVGHTGLGFTLIHRAVFARIRTPWFQFGAASGGRSIGEDVWFSNGVTQAGLAIVCDGSVHCSHFKDGLDLLRLAHWPPA
jgi:hypothetical protein